MLERSDFEVYEKLVNYNLRVVAGHKWQEHGLRDKKCFTVDLF